MRKLLLILLLPVAGWCAGPKYTYKSPPAPPGLDDEMNNIYHDIRNPVGGYATFSSVTVNGLNIGASPFTLQLIQATNTTATTTTSSTYASTNLTATITPTSATHKIKITVTGNMTNADDDNNDSKASLFRGSTDLSNGTGFATVGGFFVATGLTNDASDCPVSMSYVDSPATTSAITYTVKIKSTDNVHQTIWNEKLGTTVIILEELNF